jgi:hypothetical protein
MDPVAGDVLAMVRAALEQHPRTLQKKIGPSEVGSPCARKIGATLLGHPERPGAPNWRAGVGTAVHAYLEWMAKRNNADLPVTRWLTERKVTVGSIDGGLVEITGTSDLFDTWTGTVIDWKTASQSKLKRLGRPAVASQTHRVQAHLYGRGFAAAGHAVRRVMVLYVPRDGELAQARDWSEDYDEQIAVDALARLDGINALVQMLGLDALEQLPPVDDYCDWCPFRRMPGMVDGPETRWCDGPLGKSQPVDEGLQFSA